MLDANQSRQAAELIWRHYTAGTVTAALPPPLRPGSRTEGYAIQAHFDSLSGSTTIGWKIAATSKAGQQHIGVDGPLAGRLLASHVFPDGTELTSGSNRMAVAEAEFAFRLGRDLPSRNTPYGEDEILDAVAALHCAIEIPDSRFEPFELAGAAQLIADNACARDFVLGPAMPEEWRDADLAARKVTLRNGAGSVHHGAGAAVLGDPRVALAWLVNELSREHIGLPAGQIVTTGTCTQPLPIAPGDTVTADYGTFGQAHASLAMPG